MSWHLPTTILVAVCGLLLAGCAAQCGASAEKLAELRRGMSYEETSRIMGCSGSVVTEYGPETGDYATVEWNGPSSFFTRTRMDFLYGKLLSYTTEPRGAL
jgi:hypothetical protein